ncbi:L,D-transpeptidase [Streptomyces sp. NPDC051546]|uniref:L,D-transpeptidase n=1 Tax=Streptomyces sp. NPDC051546 TaxID=3365655 RepID=UPI0037961363
MMRVRPQTSPAASARGRGRPAAPLFAAVAGLLLLTACGSGGDTDRADDSKVSADVAGVHAAASQAAVPPKVTTGAVLDFDLIPAAGKTVGTGQPVSLEFEKPVKDKAAVEKALTVTASTPTEGSWGWVTTPSGHDRLDWRPKDPWKPGTDVTVKGTLTTVDPGGAHFDRDLERTFKIGRDQQLTADLDTHRLIVERDSKVVKSIPMSGGQPVKGRQSRLGTYALKSREPKVHMTSASVGGPVDYDVTVNWGMRVTDTGAYIHEGVPEAQKYVGNTNHSAGCIGMTPADSKWLFDNTILGDLLTIKGREAIKNVDGPGNGYADWSITYEDWKKLSKTTS